MLECEYCPQEFIGTTPREIMTGKTFHEIIYHGDLVNREKND